MKCRFRLLTVVLVLALAGPFVQPARAGESPPVVRIAATLTRTSDGVGRLAVTADIANGFHVYAQSQPRPFLATKITAAESPAVRLTGPFTPSRAPRVIKHPDLGVELHEYEGQVTWTAPVALSSAPDGEIRVQGMVFAQACTEDRCLAPQTYDFTATLRPAAQMPTRPPADLAAPNGGFSLDQIEAPAGQAAAYSVWAVLPLAFVAGFLLNLMPCVLPVVGLKLLSFVQQAHDNRRRALLLNVAYSAGLLSVLLVLATLAVVAGLGWGEQFSSTTFSVTLAAIVFAFGLSFLGVWEIAVPGFMGTAAGSSGGEGYAGAFSKGVLSTLLATPCSGPFLGSALAWAVVRPALLTYAVFACVGLGMASPYLLVGLFPRLARFLPRPGNWMVTFKQVMGFVLLATVVYLLSFLSAASVVPTVLVLLGVGFGCWCVGRVSPLESRGRRLRAWAVTAVSIAATAWLSFGWLQGVMAERFERAAQRMLSANGSRSAPVAASPRAEGDGIAWESFSPHRLEELVKDGKTVFVDFTADWCLTCKANEVAAIERPEVARLIRHNGVVALRADKTRPAPEVDATLRRLGNRAASIPFYAVFPSAGASKPIVLDGLLTSPQPVLQALHKAGPSRGRMTSAARLPPLSPG